MRRVRVDTIVLAGVMCAGWGRPAAGAAAYPGQAEASLAAAPTGLVGPQLRDLILVIRTAEDPIVAEIACRRAMQIDPHNVHVRAALAERLAGSHARPGGNPAEPASAKGPPGDARSRPTAPAAPTAGAPPPGKATLQRQDAELRARLEALRIQTARVSDAMAARRDAPRPSAAYYFHGYYPFGPGYYPWPLIYPAVPVVYGGRHCRWHPTAFGWYGGAGWWLAGGWGGGIRIRVTVRH